MGKELLEKTDFALLPEPFRGKVRDIFDLGSELLIVTTDRISAYDSILPNGIPGKGKVLNRISEFWFGKTGDIVIVGVPFDYSRKRTIHKEGE